MSFSDLEKLLTDYFTKKDLEEIRKAYEFAAIAHEEQTRKSGEPYIDHPLSTAITLAEMRMDKETIMASLLHDVPEDTEYYIEDIEKRFGTNVAHLVDGVTKLGKVRLRTPEERQAENIRKMMLAVATDIRIILIKLADRLHNIRTITAVKLEKQHGIALETLEIYAPIAHRLGMSHIKWQLEDYSFRVLNPKMYREIENAVKEKRAEREAYIEKITQKLSQHMEEEQIYADISGRPKNLYGIYRNVFIEKKDASIAEVLDMYGLRIVVDTIPACYRTLGIVHSIWSPLANRLKDYIAVPKSNGYQSLHTGVISDDGKITEIQIRTHDMHYTAEYGLAAHWRYKKEKGMDPKVEERIAWIRQLLDWQKEMYDAQEFVESLKLDLFQDEIFVFTPKGDVRNLPAQATPVDFAYSVHSDLGDRCIGAKVNHKMVSLDYELQSGDIIEILTTKISRGPSHSWLDFVKTSRARNKIKRWFRESEQEENIKAGKDSLEEELRSVLGIGISAIPKEKTQKIFKIFKTKKWEDLFFSIGRGKITARRVVDIITEYDENLLTKKQDKKKKGIKKTTSSQTGVKVEGIENLLTRFAACCKPEPGNKIVGYITRGRGITIHQKDCFNAKTLYEEEPNRMVQAYWEEKIISYYPVQIQLTVWDRIGLMKDVVTVISDLEVNINDVQYKKLNENKGLLKLVLGISDSKALNEILRNLEKVPDVLKIERK